MPSIVASGQRWAKSSDISVEGRKKKEKEKPVIPHSAKELQLNSEWLPISVR
jgi:hypothetical protein